MDYTDYSSTRSRAISVNFRYTVVCTSLTLSLSNLEQKAHYASYPRAPILMTQTYAYSLRIA